MRTRWPVLLHVLFSSWLMFGGASDAAALEIRGKAGALINSGTGAVLWWKNADLRLPPASTAKIVTALVVLERHQPDELVTIPQGPGMSRSGRLSPGERLTIAHLLYPLLLQSDNDAARALAAHAAGSAGAFATLMNENARALGAKRSRFVNPTGLPERGHFTTARDLAILARTAMRNAHFRQVVATKKYRWSGEKWHGVLTNSNRLLETYAGANGIKTGSTREAGFCLVASAERSGRNLIAVVLGSTEAAVWRDATVLLDFGLNPRG